MRYIVICYALHEKNIASHNSFYDENDAYDFLKKDAESTYKEEKLNASEDCKIEFTINNDGTAYLSSYNGEYEWTWEVIEIK